MTEEVPIHILEDSAQERDTLEMFLRENEDLRPHFLHSASPEFMSAVQQIEYGVLVIDYILSEGKSGLEILQEIQDKDKDECFYKIIVTGFPDLKVMMQFLKLRPNDFVIKGDGDEHYRELMIALRKGAEDVRRRRKKERKRNQDIERLLCLAKAIGDQLPLKPPIE